MIESQGHLTAQPYSDKSDHIGETKKMIGEFERVNEIMDEIVNQRQKKIQLDFKRARVS